MGAAGGIECHDHPPMNSKPGRLQTHFNIGQGARLRSSRYSVKLLKRKILRLVQHLRGIIDMKFLGSLRLWASTALLVFGLPMVAYAQPIDVDVELVLAVDVSGSVNPARYAAQKQGTINALRNPAVHTAIESGTIGSIAVVYMEWSGATQQSEQVPWTQISSAADANAFADAIEATTRALSGLTSISGAIDWSVASINDNNFNGTRKVIDISGDGDNNSGRSVTDARDDAVADGKIINGIAIEEVTSFSLTDYYEANVIGGPGSFVLTADTFDDFEDAIVLKLEAEIIGNGPTPIPAIPVPTMGVWASFVLVLLLLMLAWSRFPGVARRG